MRKVVVWAASVVGIVVVIAVAGLGYLFAAYPNVAAAPVVSAARTPERVARGAYLANHVSVCTDCHTPRDFSRFAGPTDDRRFGAGGEVFDESIGLPGRIISRNITPAGLGAWTDGEILRAFTEGVSRDGTSLFPLMPYDAYARMDRDDALAIVAYLRTLPAIPSELPARSLHFPVSLLVRTLPAPAAFTPRPDPGDRVATGRYLATIGGCGVCHTPVDASHVPQLDRLMAGGQEFPMPGGAIARPANLTPHDTGIGGWTEGQFIERFARFRDGSAYVPVTAGDANTVMPWGKYAGMTDADLGAIYAYLRTLPAISNRVVTMSAAR